MVKNKQKGKEIIFDEDRDLIPKEYSHLMSKRNTLPVSFFRGNMFNASAKSKHFKYKQPKMILENKDEQIFVSHALNQKHADVLNLIYSDNIGVSKPNSNGSYYIMINLFKIAKLMNYKYPKSAVGYVSNYIDEIRHSDFITYNKKTKIWTKQQILGKAHYDKNQRVFIVYVDGSNAKLLNYTTTIDISKEKIHKIVDIPNASVLLKAFIRFVISNRASKVNRNLEFFMEKLDLNRYDDNGKLTRASLNKRNAFKKLIKSNTELLSEFNVIYDDEENKIYYNDQLEDIKFHLPLQLEPDVIKKLEQDLNSFKYEYEQEKMIIEKDRIVEIVKTLSLYMPYIERDVSQGRKPEYDKLVINQKPFLSDIEKDFLNNAIGKLSKALLYIMENSEESLIDLLITKATTTPNDVIDIAKEDNNTLDLEIIFEEPEYPQIGKEIEINNTLYKIKDINYSDIENIYTVKVYDLDKDKAGFFRINSLELLGNKTI